MRSLPLVIAVVLVIVASACGSSAETAGGSADALPDTSSQPPEASTASSEPVTTSTQPTAPDPGCADVIEATLTAASGVFTASATVRSADTGEDKFADSWVVRTEGGDVLGERILTHPHVDEQPFTRTLSGLIIPDDVEVVVVAAHDSVAGFCGDTVTLGVER